MATTTEESALERQVREEVGVKGVNVHSLRKPVGADWVQDAA